jgi:hypothetical protein
MEYIDKMMGIDSHLEIQGENRMKQQQHDVADQREQLGQSGSSRRSFLNSLGILTASSGVAIQLGTDTSKAAEDGTHSFVGGGFYTDS